MSKQNGSEKKNVFSTVWGWISRTFFGASKAAVPERELTDEEIRRADVEEIVSPLKQIVRGFLERKTAVVAMCVVIFMFLFVFIGPLFMPHYRDSYTEVLQKNVAPTHSMMKVPKELKKDVKTIDSFSTFSVGLSNAGKVYVWGFSKLGATGIDVADIPEEVKNANIKYVAAGVDHIIAIGDDGKIYGWGAKNLGQYDRSDAARGFESAILIPEELFENGVDVAHVKKLECGYQCTGILMDDGTLYLWGNLNACANLDRLIDFSEAGGKFRDFTFTLNYVIGIQENGNDIYTGSRDLFNLVRSGVAASTAEKLKTFLGTRKIASCTATASNVCYVLDDGSICFSGDFAPYALVEAPDLADGEIFTSIVSGGRHYTGLTNRGNVYSFGDNTLGQCKTPRAGKLSGTTRVFAGAFQNYAVDGNDDLTAKWGLRGYLFGTDGTGSDIFQRIVNGGRMTMTVGAIAVIISTIIGIIVGCLAGYFGGKVDMVLMRVTEIFAAIPFLPFAMILSAIMGRMPFSDNARIFIIMMILGVLSWTGLARLVRGQVLVARENEYVTAAKAMGVKESVIAFKHILPNVISVIIVTLTLDFAGCMLTESSLSYLGFGVPYPRPTWGNMLNGANNLTVMNNFWWQWVFTAIFLAITTICINIVGDTLRDVMDPKSKIDR